MCHFCKNLALTKYCWDSGWLAGAIIVHTSSKEPSLASRGGPEVVIWSNVRAWKRFKILGACFNMKIWAQLEKTLNKTILWNEKWAINNWWNDHQRIRFNPFSEMSVNLRNGYLFEKQQLIWIVKLQIGENSFSIYCQHSQKTFITWKSNTKLTADT